VLRRTLHWFYFMLTEHFANLTLSVCTHVCLHTGTSTQTTLPTHVPTCAWFLTQQFLPLLAPCVSLADPGTTPAMATFTGPPAQQQAQRY